MEHSIDVSWMNHSKDKLNRHSSKSNLSTTPTHDPLVPGNPLESAPSSKVNGNTAPVSPPPSPPPTSTPPGAKPIPQPRPGIARTGTNDEKKSPGPNGTPPQRRGSWFSKLSGSFSSSPSNTTQAHVPTPVLNAQIIDDDEVSPLPKINPNKNAVLQPAARQSGDAPYVPAPPRSGQAGFLQVFRRKSSSAGSTFSGKNNHGLVERRILNVDKQRERPRLKELNLAKLRRVAFCVDVEIAPMPKYGDVGTADGKIDDKKQKRKIAEKGEGDALKQAKLNGETKVDEELKKPGQDMPAARPLEKDGRNGMDGATTKPKEDGTHENAIVPSDETKAEKDTTRKKEKKKKSEAERKAKKEQKRKEALEKGAIPMEIHLDSDSSTDDTSTPRPRPQTLPTTNPGRIYRRCCQLRETDILTKITSQLPKVCPAEGLVEKLDLTGYFMSLPDLVTLGDFLAVVPVKEVILESCGLTDEGARVILAGLLAARKQAIRLRRSVTKPADLIQQGGVVERLVLKNNKLGAEGWKHICLFIHMCRSLKCIDLSHIPFPAPSEPVKTPLSHHLHLHNGHTTNPVTQLDVSLLLSKALGERLAGPELELLNLGDTGITTNQLGAVVDGCCKCGISRLGLAHNDLDEQGIQHVARYLHTGKCQGLDLGGNDLRDHLQTIADAVSEHDDTLFALSLANSNLKPNSLCRLLPKLAQLKNFKFIDLSHNPELCESQPNAIGLLRRYLPKLGSLKRLHLADVAMTSEQAIAIAEVLPEVKDLAHINLLENPALVKLADAKTEETQEEACAVYASLMAAARVSHTLVNIEIDTPSAESSEIIKALANQLVAYCLRNMRMTPYLRENGTSEQVLEKLRYPDVLRHIVGYEEDSPVIAGDEDTDAAPDEDYVIGGTGVVKALACCLDNLGQDSRRQSGEFIRDFENGTASPGARVPAGKAKDMSKHLLSSARKIRIRLQPALAQAKASSKQDMASYSRLVFLNQTIEGIINRFEDEFPETRENKPTAAPDYAPPPVPGPGTSLSSLEVEPVFSDTEELDTELRSSSRSRSNSIMSHTSKALAEEEGRALRIGHKFRRGFIQAHFDLLTSSASIDADQYKHVEQLMDDLAHQNEGIRKKVAEKGVIKTFQEDREEIVRLLIEEDPEHWARFIESQEKARANVDVSTKEVVPKVSIPDESAIAD
ncbi:hypothetical protein BX600DRAFT_434391 [Xylariales sp. PMI_506]|nr:hypothetical protein BX600DRAFT_434391 [Xylariales sp. PMI_506]